MKKSLSVICSCFFKESKEQIIRDAGYIHLTLHGAEEAIDSLASVVFSSLGSKSFANF